MSLTISTARTKTSRIKEADPFELFERIIADNMKTTPEKRVQLFVNELSKPENTELGEVVWSLWARSVESGIFKRLFDSAKSPATLKREAAQRKRAKVDATKAHRATVNEMVKKGREEVLLNMIVPGVNRRLRDCTRADLRIAGGFFMKIADKMDNDTQTVGQKFTDRGVNRMFNAHRR